MKEVSSWTGKKAITVLLIVATFSTTVVSTLELQLGNTDIIIYRIMQDLN